MLLLSKVKEQIVHLAERVLQRGGQSDTNSASFSTFYMEEILKIELLIEYS